MFVYILVPDGQPLAIKCSLEKSLKSGDYNLTWYKVGNQTAVPRDKLSRIHQQKNLIWFLPAMLEDSGDYECVIRNLTSCKKMFTKVTVFERIDGLCLNEKFAVEEVIFTLSSAKVVCPHLDHFRNAKNFQPVRWYKDCQLLEGKRFTFTNRDLIIFNVTVHDRGNYTCETTYTYNGKQYNISRDISLTVEAKHSPLPPQILFPKDKGVIEVELGAALSLKCQARLGIKKQPIAVVTWDVDNIPVKYSDFSRFHEETHFFEGREQEYYRETTLHITEIRKEDLQTNFTCVAVNEMHNTKATVTLQLKAQYGKIYDAYVIYPKSHTNEANFVEYFVYQIMPDILENKCGYKLCIYGRDIYPGEDTASAIEKRMQKSRRLIILLTCQLINCKEHAYDQHIALYNALIQNDTKVILLEMETIGTYEKLQESLRFIVKRQGTIKWKEQHTVHPQSSNSKFWKQVRYHMPRTLRSSYSANTG
uniref:Interleukin 1 receptor like 1 n=1 Tax=Athene cunicularia TaxID=194338 RepID=A0A663LSH4_ATHCN